MKRRRWVLFAALVTLLLALAANPMAGYGADDRTAAGNLRQPDYDPVPKNDRFGIAHISYGGHETDQSRYDLAVQAGASWNRWVAYWYEIERTQGVFDYTSYDRTVAADRQHGLQLDVVLMGTPQFYATTTPAQTARAGSAINPVASAPRNLDLPVFADGTDQPGPGKAINPDNYWARFVNTTVAHYKGQVRYWEMWNEPDFSTFWWTGDGREVAHYARLLKVGYLAAKAADPDAQVLLGGLMYWEWAHRTGAANAWLQAFVTELQADRDSGRFGYYFDIIALHWYARPLDLYDKTLAVRRLLRDSGIGNKPIWVNETDLGVCGDAQTAGKPDCTNGVSKGRPEEQAAFIIQASANALAAGVDRFIAFQLNDDSMGPYEYYGLVRADGSLRPAYAAFQVAARYFRDIKTAMRVSAYPVEAVTMVTQGGQVVIALWNGSSTAVEVAIPARAASAKLVDQSGKERPITASSGSYNLSLPAATLNLTGDPQKPDFPVGGYTYVIVESPSPPAATPTATAAPATEGKVGDAVTSGTTIGPGKSIATPAATPTQPAKTSVAQPAPTATPTPSEREPKDSPPKAMAAGANVSGQPPSDGDHRLPVPPTLSTLRISDVTSDGATFSWVSTVAARGSVTCQVAGDQSGGAGASNGKPIQITAGDVRGNEVRSTTHFVRVANLDYGMSYRCSAEAGIEVEDNGGALFPINSPTFSSSRSDGTRLSGRVLAEDGRPYAGAIVYAAMQNGEETATRAALSDGDGSWTIDLPAETAGEVQLSALGAAGLAAKATIATSQTAADLRLAFTWAPYRNTTIGMKAGWNEIVLPAAPLNRHTIADFAREVAAQGGQIGAVYYWAGDRWEGGTPAGRLQGLIADRRYFVWAEGPASWTYRRLSP